MDASSPAQVSAVSLDTARPLSIAVLAMGGQGGGVLVDWIVAVAQGQGYFAQSTSVPGVAQRTGATVYYVETIRADGSGRRPVLSLMPVPGEVDLVIGAEFMEIGRAIQRGLVSPDRTVLLGSSHRAYAVAEKMAPGDGAGDARTVHEAAVAASRRFIAFDMAAIAEETNSAISAVLFGALAGSGALPFRREAYEETIRAAGIGVEASLRAFARGYEKAAAEARAEKPPPIPAELKLFPDLAPVGDRAFDALIARARTHLPAIAHPIVAAGLRHVVDFQDVDYGREYLDLVDAFAEIEAAAPEASADRALTRAAAKEIARAMAYDDVIRVADLKTRSTRFARVMNEVKARPEQIVHVTEFMHPRMEEVCGTLPARLGAWIEAHPRLFAALQRVVNRGRQVRTGTVGWFIALYLVAGMRRFRRRSLRHQREVAHREAWLAQAHDAARSNPALGAEILAARQLVKGYSDTHAGGERKFATVMAMARRLEGRSDAAAWVRRLRKAALADADGLALADAIKTIESFL
jgi:indolepyruvate ferredoxin oxidoreductase, beta subunit